MNKSGHDDDETFSISGPEVGDDAKPDVLTSKTGNQKKKQRVVLEAADAHARRRLINNLSTCVSILS